MMRRCSCSGRAGSRRASRPPTRSWRSSLRAGGNRPPREEKPAMPDTEKYRFLHTMIRVKDLDKSLAFYTGELGMNLIRKRDYPTGKFTLAFVGYGDEENSTVVE